MPLRCLAGLQPLSINARGQKQRQRPSTDRAFLSALTGLTEINLSLASCRDIGSLCCCKAMQPITLHDLETMLPEDLPDTAWLTLSGLTGLTELHMYNAALRIASSAFGAALSQLTRLESIGAGIWAPEAVPALQMFPNLECVSGAWEAGDLGGAYLATVRRLENCSGEVLFEAFMHHAHHVTQIQQSESFSTAAVLSSTKHRTGLVELSLTAINLVAAASLTLHADLALNEPATSRVAALQSLGSLRRLTRLDFAPWDNAEW
jgi:hypothetical protein